MKSCSEILNNFEETGSIAKYLCIFTWLFGREQNKGDIVGHNV